MCARGGRVGGKEKRRKKKKKAVTKYTTRALINNVRYLFLFRNNIQKKPPRVPIFFPLTNCLFLKPSQEGTYPTHTHHSRPPCTRAQVKSYPLHTRSTPKPLSPPAPHFPTALRLLLCKRHVPAQRVPGDRSRRRRRHGQVERGRPRGCGREGRGGWCVDLRRL